MHILLTRLKDRKLVQWALAYLAGAWLVLQVVDILGNQFAWPGALLRSITVLLAMGFLAALVLAWFHGEKGHQRVSGVELVMLTGILVLAGAAVAFVRGDDPTAAADREASEPPVHAAGIAADAAEKSIAVLPFANLSESKENEYFSDGITEDILTNLSRIADLRVISRTSVMGYKGTNKKLREIGEELGVSHILEGSVRRAGDRVKITAQLIDARTDEHLWAQNYDRELTAENIFQIQAEIAQQIASALQVQLAAPERSRMAGARTGSLEAYDLYLQAREYYYRPRSQDNAIAIQLFKQALELDPTYAPAYAGLAAAYVSPAAPSTAVRIDSALAAGRKAISLAPEIADGYVALGTAYRRLGRVHDAREQFQKVIQINPNHPGAMVGTAFINFELGRPDEALPLFKRAVALEPTTAVRYRQVGFTYAALGDSIQAERWARQGLRLGPDFPVFYLDLAQLSIRRGEWQKAAAQIDTAISLAPDHPDGYQLAGDLALRQGNHSAALVHYQKAGTLLQEPALVQEGYIYWTAGDRERAQAIFRDRERFYHERIEQGAVGRWPYFHLARIHAAQGATDEALRWLREAIERGFIAYDSLLTDPLLENLRSDPRFQRMATGVKAEVERMRTRVEREGL